MSLANFCQSVSQEPREGMFSTDDVKVLSPQVHQENKALFSRTVAKVEHQDPISTPLSVQKLDYSSQQYLDTSLEDYQKYLSTSLKNIFNRVRTKAKKFYGIHSTENNKLQKIGVDLYQDQGVVAEPISPGQSGRVKVCGVFWLAKLRCENSNIQLHTGQLVNVVSRIGNTLLVEPHKQVMNTPMSTFEKPFAGVVESRISPGSVGKIKTSGGVLWPAKMHEGFFASQIQPGQPVKVVARDGNTFVVTPSDPTPRLSVSEASALSISAENKRIHV